MVMDLVMILMELLCIYSMIHFFIVQLLRASWGFWDEILVGEKGSGIWDSWDRFMDHGWLLWSERV